MCVLPADPHPSSLQLLSQVALPVLGRGRDLLPLARARAVPCPQEPGLAAMVPAIGPAAASEKQCAPTVWYQIVHQNYYFQHLWLNCKTIIQMTLGVCWS